MFSIDQDMTPRFYLLIYQVRIEKRLVKYYDMIRALDVTPQINLAFIDPNKGRNCRTSPLAAKMGKAMGVEACFET
jgi:hypothetical protein